MRREIFAVRKNDDAGGADIKAGRSGGMIDNRAGRRGVQAKAEGEQKQETHTVVLFAAVFRNRQAATMAKLIEEPIKTL